MNTLKKIVGEGLAPTHKKVALALVGKNNLQRDPKCVERLLRHTLLMKWL